MPGQYDTHQYDSATYDAGVALVPTIATFSPTSGNVGTSVLISGSNFTGATAVRFNGIAGTFVVNSDTSITATVPAGATTGLVSVQNTAGTGTSGTNFTVTVPQPPDVTTFTPLTGPEGTLVTVNGTNLSTATNVRFAGTEAGFTVLSVTQLRATVPVGASSGTIQVLNPDGSDTTGASFTVTVTPPPPIPTPVITEGLEHTFRRGLSSRTLPLDVPGGPRVGSFDMTSSLEGGFQSATAEIPVAEYQAFASTLFRQGTEWLVRDVRSGRFIFGGILKEPAPAADAVTLQADGWGLDTERLVERFLLSNANVENWNVADGDPFPDNWTLNSRRYDVAIRGNRIQFRVPRHTSFKRNNAGNPSNWPSPPVVFWAPGLDPTPNSHGTRPKLRWVYADVQKNGGDGNAYDLQLVGTPTGPTGSLQVIRTWALGADGDMNIDYQIPGNYDLVGFRLVRTRGTDNAKSHTVRLKNVQIGSVATTPTFRLSDAFTEIFRRMGVAVDIPGGLSTEETDDTPENPIAIPYDAARVSLAQVADDLALFGNWYWRVVATDAGTAVGQAGPLGHKSYTVVIPQTPVSLLTADRFNVIQYPYRYGGGYEAQGTLRATNDFAPAADYVFQLDLTEPPVKGLAEALAQQVIDQLAMDWSTGDATLYQVLDGATVRPGTVVHPGDKLVLANHGNAEVIVSDCSITEDGSLNSVEFLDSAGRVEEMLAQREMRLNMGLSGDAATMWVTDPLNPAKPTGFIVGFVEEELKNGDSVWAANLDWAAVTEDVQGEGTAVKRYETKARPLNKDNNNPIPRPNGGGWRRHSIHKKPDDEGDDTSDPILDAPTEDIYNRLQNPTKWRWEFYVRAEDLLGRLSQWAGPVRGVPSNYSPPQVNAILLDVDAESVTFAWDFPPDPLDATKTHPGIAKVRVQLSAGPAFTQEQIIRNSTTDNDHIRWQISRKALKQKRQNLGLGSDLRVYARVAAVDSWGTQSAWSEMTALGDGPATPGAPRVRFLTADGAKERKLRCVVDFTQATLDAYLAGSLDDITEVIYQMQLGELNAKRNPINPRQYSNIADARHDWKFSIPVPEEVLTGDNLRDSIQWGRVVHKGWPYRVRARFRARRKGLSAWGPWSGPIGGTGHPNASEGIGALATLTAAGILNPPGRKAGDALPENPLTIRQTLRAVEVEWSWPQDDTGQNDDDVSGFDVTLSDVATFTTTVERGVYVGTRARFEARNSWPKDGTGAYKTLFARVVSQDEFGNFSDPRTTAQGAGPGPVDAEIILPGAIKDMTSFAAGIRPVSVVTTLPTPGTTTYPEGTLAYLTLDMPDIGPLPDGTTGLLFPGKTIYRVEQTTPGIFKWTATTDAQTITGQLTSGQIAAGAIKTGQLDVGAVTAENLAAELLFAKTFTLLEGGTIRTAQTGTRIELRNIAAEPDRIRFINGNNGVAYLRPNQRTYAGGQVHNEAVLEGGDIRFGLSALHGHGPAEGMLELQNPPQMGASPQAGAGPRIYYDQNEVQAASLKIVFPNGNIRTIDTTAGTA